MAADAVGAQPMLVLTGKGEKTLRDGDFPEEHGDLPGPRVRRVGAARGRLNRARDVRRCARSLFLLFQIVVTPFYAAVMLLAVLDARACRCTGSRRRGAAPTSGARAGSAASAIASIGAENIPVDAAHRDVEAQLDVGDAGAHAVLSAARLRRQEGAPVDPVLRLGIRARVADHDRPQGRHRRDAADRGAGPRAVPAGLLDRRLSRKARGSAPARAPSTRPAARGSRIELGVADAAGRAQRRLPVAERPLRQASRNDDDLDRQADLAGRQGRADADCRKSRRGSRPKSRGSAMPA